MPWAFLPAIFIMVAIFVLSAQPAEESSVLSEYAGYKIFTVANDVLGLGWTQNMIGQMTIEMENFLRKAAHFTEYLLLAVALRHGFVRLLRERSAGGPDNGQAENAKSVPPEREMLLSCGAALLIAVLYAASDEFHQSFVPGRSCMLGDVGIDSLGALAGILLCLLAGLLRYWTGKIRNRTQEGA